jgi:hypothetical protein
MTPNTNTEIALLKQAMDFQNKEIKLTNETVARIEAKLDNMSESFATKSEHKDNSNKIDRLNDSVSSINLRIALATGGFTVLLFAIEKIWK